MAARAPAAIRCQAGEDDKQCLICMDKRGSVVFCGHQQHRYCGGCYEQLLSTTCKCHYCFKPDTVFAEWKRNFLWEEICIHRDVRMAASLGKEVLHHATGGAPIWFNVFYALPGFYLCVHSWLSIVAVYTDLLMHAVNGVGMPAVGMVLGDKLQEARTILSAYMLIRFVMFELFEPLVYLACDYAGLAIIQTGVPHLTGGINLGMLMLVGVAMYDVYTAPGSVAFAKAILPCAVVVGMACAYTVHVTNMAGLLLLAAHAIPVFKTPAFGSMMLQKHGAIQRFIERRFPATARE
jgi:hypothetical protein